MFFFFFFFSILCDTKGHLHKALSPPPPISPILARLMLVALGFYVLFVKGIIFLVTTGNIAEGWEQEDGERMSFFFFQRRQLTGLCFGVGTDVFSLCPQFLRRLRSTARTH